MAVLRRRSGSRDRRVGESPFTERGFIAAAGVMAVVLMSGAAVLMTDPAPPPASGAGSPPATDAGTEDAPSDGLVTESAAAPGDLAEDGSCPELPAQDQERPSGQPTGTTWRLVEGRLLPFSTHIGPAQERGEVARCFAHTPTGAVFAAVQATWRYQRATDWAAIAQNTLAPGPGREAYVQQRMTGTGPNAAPFSPAPNAGTPQPLGFRVVSYAPERAEIDVVSGQDRGFGDHAVWTVVWSGNDWRLLLGSGAEPARGAPGKEDDAFVEWDQTSMASAWNPGPDAETTATP